MTVRKMPFVLAALCLATGACIDSARRCASNPCGTAVILTRAEPASLFPPSAGGGPDFVIGDLVFLKLADLGLAMNTVGDSGFVPRLARSWRFDNPLTLTFTLDPRARWHDGQPVTASDVVFTFEIHRDTLVNSPARPLLSEITSVTAPDDHTVTFRFRRAYPEQFYDATHHMRIIPHHLMDSIPRGRLTSHALARAPIGNGPYRLAAWKAGESLELVADSAFFLGRPGLARLIFRVTPDFNTAVTQLMAGDADFMEYLGVPENADRVATAPSMRIVEYPSTSFMFLDLNLWDPGNLSRPHPLFGSRDLRRALFQAIDRRKLVSVTYGRYGTPAVGPVIAALPLGLDTTIPQLPYDTAAARTTLAGLGWRDSNGDGILDRGGQRLAFEVILPTSSLPRQRAFVVLQEQLKQVGVGVTPVNVDFGVMRDRTEHRRFHASLMLWNDDPTPSSIRQTFTAAGIGGSNYRGYRNPEFDRLVALAVAEFDPVRARARWREAYALINQDVPGVWLAAPIQFGAVHRRLENVSLRADQWSATLWTWRVAPGQAIPRDLVGPGSGSR